MECKDQTYRRLESLKTYLSPKYLTIKNFKNFTHNFIYLNIAGSVIKTPSIATIIAKEVNSPKKIVGVKLDKHSTEKPKAIVIDVVKTAWPTVLWEFLKESIIDNFSSTKLFLTLYK